MIIVIVIVVVIIIGGKEPARARRGLSLFLLFRSSRVVVVGRGSWLWFAVAGLIMHVYCPTFISSCTAMNAVVLSLQTGMDPVSIFYFLFSHHSEPYLPTYLPTKLTYVAAGATP